MHPHARAYLCALAAIGVVACEPDAPIRSEDVPAQRAPALYSGALPACGTYSGGQIDEPEAVFKYWNCGEQIYIRLDALDGTNFRGDAEGAINEWASAMGASGLPRVTFTQPSLPYRLITVTTNATSSTPGTAKFCGFVSMDGQGRPTNINMATPSSQCGSFLSVFMNELAIVHGFHDNWDKTAGADVSDHCARFLPNAKAVNTGVCQHEVEDFYKVYGVRSGPQVDIGHHILTGVLGPSSQSLSSGASTPVAVASVHASRANPALCGNGGPLLMLRVLASLRALPGAPCHQEWSGTDAGTVATFSWQSSNTSIVNVQADPGGRTATLTAGQSSGTATVTINLTPATGFDEASGGVSTTFLVTVTAPPHPASVSLWAGGGQTAPPGSTLPVDPAVRVLDQNGQPYGGAQVTFTPAPGSGTVQGGTQVTNSQGVAIVGSWTLGPNLGVQTLTANVSGSGITGNPVTITATAQYVPPVSDFSRASCEVRPYGSKNYAWHQVTWSIGSVPIGTKYQISETSTASPSASSIISSGKATLGGTELGGYLMGGSPSNRYWWIRLQYPDSSTTAWVAHDENPVQVNSCLF